MRSIITIVLFILTLPAITLSSGFVLDEVNEPKTLNIVGDT